jgi:hypothetical protein
MYARFSSSSIDYHSSNKDLRVTQVYHSQECLVGAAGKGFPPTSPYKQLNKHKHNFKTVKKPYQAFSTDGAHVCVFYS